MVCPLRMLGNMLAKPECATEAQCIDCLEDECAWWETFYGNKMEYGKCCISGNLWKRKEETNEVKN